MSLASHQYIHVRLDVPLQLMSSFRAWSRSSLPVPAHIISHALAKNGVLIPSAPRRDDDGLGDQ